VTGALLASVSVLTCQVPRSTPVPPKTYDFLRHGFISDDSLPVIRARIPYTTITLEREACFGTCPAYKVTLFKDGHATYVGTEYIPRVGHFHGQVDIWDFGRLAYFIDQQRIDTLQGRYAAAWTDAPTATVTLTRQDGRIVTIEDYGEVGPIELWALREAIDAAGQKITWSADSTH
jgi:hypothetical protein